MNEDEWLTDRVKKWEAETPTQPVKPQKLRKMIKTKRRGNNGQEHQSPE